MKLNVNIKLSRGMSAPEYATSGSAAVDLRAAIEENETVILAPGERKLIPTGLSISPESSEYVAVIAGRSGLGVKKGVSLANYQTRGNRAEISFCTRVQIPKKR